MLLPVYSGSRKRLKEKKEKLSNTSLQPAAAALYLNATG